MTSVDTSNNPKAGSTCNLVHDRFVIMADGCWMEGEDACNNYGFNPLVYSIAAIGVGTSNADWYWIFEPSWAGYDVPQQIYEVLGWSAR